MLSKKHIFISVLALVLLISSICVVSATTNISSLTQIPNGDWDFSIAENPSTGYHWEWCNHDPTEKLVDSFFVSDNPNIIGSPGRMHFIIHIETDGKGHYILLNLISPTGDINDTYDSRIS